MVQVILVLLLMLYSVPAVSALPVPATVPDDVDALFIDQTWNRTDQPVATASISRTWIWGDTVSPPVSEPYDGAAATYSDSGQSAMTLHEDERIVQYFDKARMEYDENRQADPPWNVTTGLLAKELMTGELQLGDGLLVQRPFANIPVAGDPDSGDITPAYSGFGFSGPIEPYADGSIIDRHLVNQSQNPNSGGLYEWYVAVDPRLAEYDVTAIQVETPTDFSLAEPFWDYMNSTGIIWEDGQPTTGRLFLSSFYATGYPLTNPYWVRARVHGVEKDVLVQCFERRCLTYTPDNPDGWKVEFGNVGQHYYTWRYETLGTEITGDVTGYAIGHEYQEPSVITVQTTDITYAVQVQLLQNIVLPMAGSCYADEALAYIGSRFDDAPIYFDESLRFDERGIVVTTPTDGIITVVANRIWIGTEFLNETLVREGYAVVSADPHGTTDGWVRYPSPLLRERLQAAQAQAQADGKGLWGACDVPAEIAYVVVTTAGDELRVTDAFGGYQRSVLLRSMADLAWSPDGSRVAGGGLCIVTVDTMSAICPVPGGQEPSWSPDGSQLVFSFWVEMDGRESNRELFIINADGSNLRQLTTTPESETQPEWSPDGNRIVFLRSSETIYGDLWLGDIFSIHPDGSGDVNLTNDSSMTDLWPSWSPDGEWIAFTKRSGSDTFPQTLGVYVMRSDGSQLRQVSSDDSDGHVPAWSPDGATIAFMGSGGVYLVAADGTDERLLTPGSFPSWSPDGSRLVVTSKPDDLLDDPYAPNMHVYVVNVDGSGRKKLTQDQVFERSPAWVSESSAN